MLTMCARSSRPSFSGSWGGKPENFTAPRLYRNSFVSNWVLTTRSERVHNTFQPHKQPSSTMAKRLQNYVSPEYNRTTSSSCTAFSSSISLSGCRRIVLWISIGLISSIIVIQIKQVLNTFRECSNRVLFLICLVKLG